jgi:hypothetical protein
MREFQDESGRTWHAIATDCTVAHAQTGACLAFRPADEPDATPIAGGVTFNSAAAAATATRTLGTRELRRRLRASLQVSGG